MKSGILIVNHLLKIFFIVFIILFLIGVILISCFKLDITAHGTGIIKTKNWIDVKPEIEGIIKEMLIKENQKVNIGDILFTLENRERKVGVEAMKAKIDDLNNQISRLNQEISLMGNRIPLEIEEAKANLDAARAKYKVILSGAKTEELKLAENRINLSSLNLKKVSIDRRRLQEAFALKIVKKEDLENIYHREETCKIDLAMARQEKKALENKYDNNQIMAVKADVERFRAMYNRVVYRKKEPEILQQNLKSLIVAKAKEEKQMVVTLAQEGLTRVKAPMNGYVLTHDTKHLIGKAVKPGETILRLGDDNEFIVEAKISEVDFPLIKINQKAKVQIKPFPKGEYRLFDGTVLTVGADMKEEGPPAELGMMEKFSGLMKNPDLTQNPEALKSFKESYFPVILRLEKPYKMRLYGNSYEIKPGYSAEVDIITNQERIFTFLLRRVLRIKGMLSAENIHLNKSIDTSLYPVKGASVGSTDALIWFLVGSVFSVAFLLLYRWQNTRRIKILNQRYLMRKDQAQQQEIELSEDISYRVMALAKAANTAPEKLLSNNDAFEKAVAKLKKTMPSDPLLIKIPGLRQDLGYIFLNRGARFICTQMLQSGQNMRVGFKSKVKIHFYVGTIINTTEEGFWVKPPTVKGKTVNLSKFKSFDFSIFRKNDGEYRFSSKLKSQITTPVNALVMEHVNDIKKLHTRE